MATGAVEELHERARRARPGDLRRRAGRLQLAVAVHQLRATNHDGQERLIRHLEKERQNADKKGDDIERAERQRIGEGQDGDEREQGEAREIRDDQDWAAAQAIDPDPGEQPEEQEGRGARRREEAHIRRARVQRQRGGERQREHRDLRPELRDRLPGPQFEEIGHAARGSNLTPRPPLHRP